MFALEHIMAQRNSVVLHDFVDKISVFSNDHDK